MRVFIVIQGPIINENIYKNIIKSLKIPRKLRKYNFRNSAGRKKRGCPFEQPL